MKKQQHDERPAHEIQAALLSARKESHELSLKLTEARRELIEREAELQSIYSINTAPVAANYDPKKARAERQRHQSECKERIERLKASVGLIERRQKALNPEISELSFELSRRKAVVRAAERDRAERAVETAVSSASDLEGKFRFEMNKLEHYRRQLKESEAELNAVQNPSTSAETAATRVETFMASGELPVLAADKAQRVRELLAQQRILRDALRIQERIMADARRNFASAVIAGLRPVREQLVFDLVTAYTQARELTWFEAVLRQCFHARTGSADHLEPLGFKGIPMPSGDGAQDGFEFYLEHLRGLGYAV